MNPERVYTVIQAPHMSEKASLVGDTGNQFVFRVAVDATKREIKAAIEQLFKVKVKQVRTLNVKGKVKRNRFGYSKKPNWKKAYVSLQDGHEIDLAVAD